MALDGFILVSKIPFVFHNYLNAGVFILLLT